MKSKPEFDARINSNESIRIPFGRVASVGMAVLICVAVFELLVPSKASVDQMSRDVQSLQHNQSVDHDTVTKLSEGVDYIRKWVEKQQSSK